MGLFSRSSGRHEDPPPALPAVGAAQFDTDVLEASAHMPVIVDFWAPWCRPCVAMTPVLVELAQAYSGRVAVVAVNTQDEPELAARLQVLSLPLVSAYVDGVAVARLHGAQPKKQLAELFETAVGHAEQQ